MVLTAFLVALQLVALPTSSEEPATQSEQQPRAAQPVYDPEPPAYYQPRPSYPERIVGIHIGVNVGLFALDVQASHAYFMIAGNAGVPLLTNGSIGSFLAMGGYSTVLTQNRRSSWKIDFLLALLPGFDTLGAGSTGFVFGGGVVLGFRYEGANGLSVGFRIPVFGYVAGFGRGEVASAGVARFFLDAAITLPIVSFGYRF